MAPVTDCMKGKTFIWTKVAELAFQLIKEKLITTPILVKHEDWTCFEENKWSGLGYERKSERLETLEEMQVEEVTPVIAMVDDVASGFKENISIATVSMVEDVRLEKDRELGEPLIPIQLGDFKTDNALLDFGARVSVLPRYVYDMYELGPLQQVNASMMVLAEYSHDGMGLEWLNTKIGRVSRKISGVELKILGYVVQAVKHWRHYLFHKEFVLFTNHDSLRHIRSQDKVSDKHAWWMALLEKFTFVVKHKSGISNRVADALSRRSNLLVSMRVVVPGLDSLMEQLTSDPYFSVILQDVQFGKRTDFSCA
ncbi:uncharacterized protein LOC118485127 [Helianthus annuus]|uniref:uncharacterized protein LOC118485127 n=1 Tax=Helianthus annuus TaxID=4232 RepID=UPI00165326AB|nr:uncharacterized protein LOC118485127 [Helianthus annuus]